MSRNSTLEDVISFVSLSKVGMKCSFEQCRVVLKHCSCSEHWLLIRIASMRMRLFRGGFGILIELRVTWMWLKDEERVLIRRCFMYLFFVLIPLSKIRWRSTLIYFSVLGYFFALLGLLSKLKTPFTERIWVRMAEFGFILTSDGVSSVYLSLILPSLGFFLSMLNKRSLVKETT